MKKENFVNNKGKSYYLGLKNKYITAAKEAASSGDKILSEYNLQYAEHYSRVIAEKFKAAIKSPLPKKEDGELTEETAPANETQQSNIN